MDAPLTLDQLKTAIRQGAVSTLDFDFAGYAGQHFERLARTAEDQRFRAALDGRE